MAKQLNYNEIETALSNFRAFKGNSCHANGGGVDYVVISYNTPVAYINRERGIVRLNARKYSSTTSRLQTIIRRAWQHLEIEEVHATEELYK